MNLLKLDFKVIVILVLIGVVVFQQCDNGEDVGETTKIGGKRYEIIKHKIDTFEVVKTKTVVKKGKDIYHDTTIYVNLPKDPIDTMSILKNYYSKNVYKDTLLLTDSLGYVTVLDTISKNTISHRTYDYKVKQRTIHDQKILKELPKNQVYYGFMLGFGKPQPINAVGGSLILKTKNEKMYQVGLGLTNHPNSSNLQPFVNSGIYWKIKLK